MGLAFIAEEPWKKCKLRGLFRGLGLLVQIQEVLNKCAKIVCFVLFILLTRRTKTEALNLEQPFYRITQTRFRRSRIVPVQLRFEYDFNLKVLATNYRA